MSESQLEFPPITGQASEVAETKKPVATIREAAVAHMRAYEPALLALAERYRNVALDLSTPKGLAAGQAALTELRENGRYAVQRARDGAKDLLNGAKKDVVEEADRLIAIIQPIESHVEAQVSARKAQLEAEEAEKKRINEERVAKHKASIEKIRGYLEQAKGRSSAEILDALQALRGVKFNAAPFEEFAPVAEQALVEVLYGLEQLHEVTKAREDELAALEAQRIEQERVAAEQARVAAELAEATRKLNEQIEIVKQRAREAEDRELEARNAVVLRRLDAERIAQATQVVEVARVEEAKAKAVRSEVEMVTNPPEVDGNLMRIETPALAALREERIGVDGLPESAPRMYPDEPRESLDKWLPSTGVDLGHPSGDHTVVADVDPVQGVIDVRVLDPVDEVKVDNWGVSFADQQRERLESELSAITSISAGAGRRAVTRGSDRMSISGVLEEIIDYQQSNMCAISIGMENGRSIVVTGLLHEEARALAPLFLGNVRIIVEAA